MYFGKCIAKMCNVDCRLWIKCSFNFESSLIFENKLYTVYRQSYMEVNFGIGKWYYASNSISGLVDLKRIYCALPFYNVWDANLNHAKCTLIFIMQNFKFKKVALWFFILQFSTGTPGRFLRVGCRGWHYPVCSAVKDDSLA